MNLNQGKRNKQAVQVLNKVEYDSEGNPIGMIEDPSNPTSANFGTPREPRRGGCYRGDGSTYITITGLLSTDTVEVFDGSDVPTISNDRLDIASGDRVFGVKIFRAGELWAKYNCSENSGNIAYDSSGNGNHGTIVNAITTTPEENPNSIHQYQDVYSFENEEGYSELGSVLIPKNSSITLPPFKDVLGNNLQYVGKVPGKAKFVESSCFLSDGNAYLSGDVLTTDTITAHSESEIPVCTTDGRLDFPIVGGKYFDIAIERDGSAIARLPLCEPIIDPSNHIYHDVSGNGNHATLVNGTLANESRQDKFHYLQMGLNTLNQNFIGRAEELNYTLLSGNVDLNAQIFKFYRTVSVGQAVMAINDALPGVHYTLRFKFQKYGTASSIYVTYDGGQIYTSAQSGTFEVPDFIKAGQIKPQGLNGTTNYVEIWDIELINNGIIPASNLDNSLDAYGNPITIPQDAHSFLNTGTELEAYDYPALKQADKDNNFWYIGDAGVRRVSHYELAIENLMSDKIFLDRTDKNI